MDAGAYNSYKRSSAANVINSMLPRAPNSIPPSTRPLPPSFALWPAVIYGVQARPRKLWRSRLS